MKILSVVTIFLLSIYSHADEKVFTYKNWKTFKSDFGYEFRYPDCWSVEGDGPDEPRVASGSSKDIFIGESKTCARAKMNPEVPNGISVSAGWGPLISKDDAIKKIETSQSGSEVAIQRDEWKIYKRIKVGSGGEAYIYVENEKFYKWIRWDMGLYCPSQYIHIVGPSIKNPAESYDKKFKADDLALPEPEKTIYESIKCIEPKKKSSPKMKK